MMAHPNNFTRPRTTSDQQIYTQAHNEFIQKLNSCTLKAECGNKFVLKNSLRKWLRTPVSTEASATTQFNRLVKAARTAKWPNRPGAPFYNSSNVLGKLGMVFCILFKINHGHLIEQFQRSGIDDSTLRMGEPELKKKIRHAVELLQDYHDIEGICIQFEEERWLFNSQDFEEEMSFDFDDERYVLPILRRHLITNKGGTATLWNIVVPEEYIGAMLKKKISSSLLEDEHGDEGKHYCLALKVFDGSDKQRFHTEKRAFQALHDQNGMVKYLGNFDRLERPRLVKYWDVDNTEKHISLPSKSHNILLEFGECDLDEWFIQCQSPMFNTELLDFWADLFDVAKTVEGVHNLRDPASPTETMYRGLHNDIKPANILLVDGKFKLADPGFMKFFDPGSEDEFLELSDGGTVTYGPPEIHPAGKGKVTPQVDIWSLGCVFSVTATWVVAGAKGIHNYMVLRESATSQLQKDGHLKGEPGDHFHDGEKVLRAVTEWHDVLRQSRRATDFITPQVLDLIDKRMFCTLPDDRIDAKGLCKELGVILEGAWKRGPGFKLPSQIEDSLYKTDNEPAPGTSKFLELLSGKNFAMNPRARKQRKKELYDAVARRTTYKAGSSSREHGNSDLLQRSNRSPSGGAHILDVKTAQANSASIAGQYASGSGGGTDPKHVSNHEAKDIFQIHYERASRQSLRYTDLRTRLMTKFQEKEHVLRDHLDERDMVFVMDNAESMDKWWAKAKFTLGILASELEPFTRINTNLHFTIGNEGQKEGSLKREKDVLRAMNAKQVQPRPGRQTDMIATLGRIFEEHKTGWSSPFSKSRALTLIILTDGQWVSTVDKTALKTLLAKFIRYVYATFQYRKSPVSIEFVRFGADFTSWWFLKQLDDKWCLEEKIQDVIDTESCDGDVYKMLLGSFVDSIDNKEDPTHDLVSPTLGSP